jgi:hypothetical protein
MSKDVTRTHIVVPTEILRSVDILVGHRGRSRFFAEAVAEKLARAKRATILKDAAGALAGRDTPDWGTREETAAWLRRSREADDNRLTAPADGG